LKQNPFFFSKAESATNGFKAGNLVNIIQMQRGGRGPLVLSRTGVGGKVGGRRLPGQRKSLRATVGI
jgi:hypothetical protein